MITANDEVFRFLENLKKENNITHDYEDDIEYQVKMINDVCDAYKEILKIFANIKTKFNSINGS